MIRSLFFRRSESLIIWLIFVIKQVAVISEIESDFLATDGLLGRRIRKINVHGNLTVFIGIKVVVDNFELTEMLSILELKDIFVILLEQQRIKLIGRYINGFIAFFRTNRMFSNRFD
jgi:hypothetical protein